MSLFNFVSLDNLHNNDNVCPIPPAAPNTATLACTGDVLDVNDRLHLLNRLQSLGSTTSA